MMFDWSDQDQVGETIWDDLNESEDHIVPYPQKTEELRKFPFQDCSNKQRSEDANCIAPTSGQSSRAKSDFPGSILENSSVFIANQDQSDLGLDVGTWPDLPSLNTELSTGDISSVQKSLIKSSIGSDEVQLHDEPEIFGNARQDKENDSFLDCDWSNINDFDDLDKILRNEPIFGNGIISNVDEFLSSSSDMIGSMVQSIPTPDIPLSRDHPSDEGCSSFQSNEQFGGERKAEDKIADTVETSEEAFCQIPHGNQLMEKDERKRKLLKSHKKAEERSKNKVSQVLAEPWSQNISQYQQFSGQNLNPIVITPPQDISSAALAHPSKVSGAELSSSQFMNSPYGYPAYPFPGVPVMQHVQACGDGRSNFPFGQNLSAEPIKYPNTASIVPVIQSKPLAMTPHEKKEKLRRRQQAHAILAIQQQRQQFGHQIGQSEKHVSEEKFEMNKGQDAVAVKGYINVEENENKLPPSDLNLFLEHDNSQRTSASNGDNSLEKTIFCQLQDALRKLDIRVKLCIRDSLFRLASSSKERQTTSDRSSTNKRKRDEPEVPIHEEMNSGERPIRLLDAETYTNPVDRAVAHLLFHRPLESSTRPLTNEIPQSLVMHDTVSQLPPNVSGSMSGGEPESLGDMDLQPSVSK